MTFIKSLLLALGLLSVSTIGSQVAQAAQYFTDCEVDNGLARGYVTVASYDAITISGYVNFRFFSAEGRPLGDRSAYAYSYIYHATREVKSVNAPSGTASCAFEVDSAIDDSGGGGGGGGSTSYTTTCQIVGNTASGYIVPARYQSVTVSGNVEFIFYAANGRIIGTPQRVYAYVYTYNDRKLVKSIRAVTGATRCSLDVSGAVN